MVDYLRRVQAQLRAAKAETAKAQKVRARAAQAQEAATRPRRPAGRPQSPDRRTPLRAREIQEREERAHSYVPQRPAFAHLINLGEPGRGVPHARLMVDRIVALTDRGGWTTSERTMLYMARTRWQRRVEGKDARYLVVGNKRGRLTAAQQQQVKALADAMAVGAVVDEVIAEAVRAAPGIGRTE